MPPFADLIEDRSLNVTSLRLEGYKPTALLPHGEYYEEWFKKKVANVVTDSCLNDTNDCAGENWFADSIFSIIIPKRAFE